MLRPLGDRSELPDRRVLGVEGLLAGRRRRGEPADAAAPRRVRRRRLTSTSTSSGGSASRPDTATTGRPGRRPQYSEDYYGAFLLDPDGNSAEAVHDSKPNRAGIIDHLWIRVADVARAKAFYETIAPHAGLRLGDDTPDRVQFRGAAGGSFSLVPGHADRARPHGVPDRRRRRRASGSTTPRRAPATGAGASPASGRSITAATTPPTCSIPTATTSRSSTTTGTAAAVGLRHER